MDECEIEVIVKNLDKLVKITICNFALLASLRASGILSDDDVDVLIGLGNNRSNQVFQLYSIVQKRQNGFESLLEGLNQTNQSGVVAILTGVQKRSAIDNSSISYDVNTVLGKGSYGTVVYKGKFGKRDVAVKKVHLDMFGGDQALNEVNVLTHYDKHENIVRYFGAKQTGEIILIALELCEMSLNQWVANKSNDIPQLDVLKQVTVGLEWLHSQKLVHRDLKPENVLIMQQLKRVKLSDFGLSRRILDGNSFVATAIVGGTPGWIAPEILAYVVQGNQSQCKFTYASDVFALGCVYYYVLTDGKLAFGDALRCQGNILDGKSMIKPIEIKHGCTQNLLFINLMIAKDPKSRPNCSALLSFPFFWSSNDRVRFLEEIKVRGEVLEEVKHFNTQDPCNFDHREEVSVLKRIGCPENQGIECVLPFAYLRCNGIELDLMTTLTSSVAELPPKITLTKAAPSASNPFRPSIYPKPECSEGHKVVGNKSKAASGNSTFTGAKIVENDASNASAPVANLIERFNKIGMLPIQQNKTMQQKIIDVAHTQGRILPENCAKYTGQTDSPKSTQSKVDRILIDLKVKNAGLKELIKKEDLDTIKEVLEKHKDMNNDEKELLLVFGVVHREYELVEYLINKQWFGSLLTKPVFNNSLIHECIEDIHLIDAERFKEKCMILELLFTKNPLLIESKTSGGYQWTPLFVATEREFKNAKQLEFIQFLLSHNADVNGRSYIEEEYSNRTPLHEALFNHSDNQLELILLLIDHKADVNARAFEDYTPLHYAVMQKPLPPNMIEIIKLLIESGANPDAVDKDGRTFLHIAPQFLTPELYAQLIEYFDSTGRTKSLKMVDNYYGSHLHWAVRNFEPLKSTLEIFKKRGLDFNALDKYGNSVLFHAIEGGRSASFLNQLNSYGADWTILNKNQDNPLNYAAYRSNLDALKMFLSLGYDVNASNLQGRTPLHMALTGKRYNKDIMTDHEVVKLLLENGADVNAKNKGGKVPIDLANERAKIGFVEERTLKLLKTFKPKINSLNKLLRKIF